MSLIWQILIPVFWAIVTILLFLKNRSLAGRLESSKMDAEFYRIDRDKLSDTLEDTRDQVDDYVSKIVEIEEELAHALNERNDAMMHLEETLNADVADRVVPDRIAVEAGMNGIYYTFKYDPPEYAEVTPLPQLTGSSHHD